MLARAFPQSNRNLLPTSYRNVAKYYWVIVVGVAIFVLFFIFVATIHTKPSPARISITVVVVVLYFSFAYFCWPKRAAGDPSDYLLPNIVISPPTLSQTSSMRREAEDLDASIDLVVPAFLYSRKMGDGSSGGSSPRQVICSVCLQIMQEEEPVRQLPGCEHIFHAGCIARWLPLHMSCPNCRSEIELARYAQAAEERNATVEVPIETSPQAGSSQLV